MIRDIGPEREWIPFDLAALKSHQTFWAIVPAFIDQMVDAGEDTAAFDWEASRALERNLPHDYSC